MQVSPLTVSYSRLLMTSRVDRTQVMNMQIVQRLHVRTCIRTNGDNICDTIISVLRMKLLKHNFHSHLQDTLHLPLISNPLQIIQYGSKSSVYALDLNLGESPYRFRGGLGKLWGISVTLWKVV